MNNDANLPQLLARMSGVRADFADTTPSAMTPADDVAWLFGAFGVQTLRAWLIELGSMRCTHAWQINKAGAMAEAPRHDEPNLSFPTSMATIVQLSPAGPAQTQKRQLDPLRWAFAWPVDQHHVVVVEARYRIPRNDHGDADIALVRLACDAGLRAAQVLEGGAWADDHRRLASSAVEIARPVGRSEGAPIRSLASASLSTALAGRPASASSWRGASRRVVFAVLALGLAVAGSLFALQQSAKSLRMESALQQTQADATMTQAVGKALSEGDYGEVQAELASFAARQYFESALVTNTHGRVVAAAGPIHGMRMGDPLTTFVAQNARAIELNDKTGANGQLLVWERSAQDGAGFGSSGMAIAVNAAMLISFSSAAAATILLLKQRRRRLQRRGAAGR